MLDIRSLSFSYPDTQKVIDNFTCSFSRGERVCISAASGAGKTTLFRLILSLEKPLGGEIRIKKGAKLSFVPQKNDLFPWYTALENVVIAGSNEADAEKWLDSFSLGESKMLLPSKLSGGMQKRVALARACACEPDILIIDEGFTGLDAGLKDKVMTEILRHFNDRLIIFSSHDQSEIDSFATRVVTL